MISGMELEELTRRIKGMTREEKEIAAKYIDDEVLLLELKNRYRRMQDIISGIDKIVQRYIAE